VVVVRAGGLAASTRRGARAARAAHAWGGSCRPDASSEWGRLVLTARLGCQPRPGRMSCFTTQPARQLQGRGGCAVVTLGAALQGYTTMGAGWV
jgi:hypothetical protein